MNSIQPPLVLVAGHIVNFGNCSYAYLGESSIIVEYPDDTLEIDFDSDADAAAAMISITNQLSEHGCLLSAVPKQ